MVWWAVDERLPPSFCCLLGGMLLILLLLTEQSVVLREDDDGRQQLLAHEKVGPRSEHEEVGRNDDGTWGLLLLDPETQQQLH